MILLPEVMDTQNSNAGRIQMNPPPDRSNYWIKAHQLSLALTLIDWHHPHQNVEDPVHTTRSWLSRALKTLLSKGYSWWVVMGLRIDAGEEFGFHTLGFLFLHLRHHFDDRQKYCPDEDTQKMVWSFYWCHMNIMMKNCSCKSCTTAIKALGNRAADFEDDARQVIFTALDFSENNIESIWRAMMGWEVEDPSIRKTEDYLRRQENFKLSPSIFGALGTEFHSFHRIAHPTVESISELMKLYDLDPVRHPSFRDVVRVTKVEELTDPECVICYSAFDMDESIGSLPPSRLHQQPARARCGHVLCFKCYKTILKRNSAGNCRCPYCRVPFVSPPEWLKNRKQLFDALHDRESNGEEVVDHTLKSLDEYSESLPAIFRFHEKFLKIEVGLTMFMEGGRLYDVLQIMLGPTDTVIPQITSRGLSGEGAGLWAYKLLRLNGERLRAFREGDTERYRQVLKLMWPVFVQYNIVSCIAQVDLWIQQIG